MTELRIICKYEDAQVIMYAVKTVFEVSQGRHYDCRRSADDIMLYMTVKLRKYAVPSNTITVNHDLDPLKIRPEKVQGKNHIVVTTSFLLPRYLNSFEAEHLNRSIQSGVRSLEPGITGVNVRFDQTARQPGGGMVLYHTGAGEWLTFPSAEFPGD